MTIRRRVSDQDPRADNSIEWIRAFSSKKISQIVLTSHGSLEHDVPSDYAKELRDLFAQLGVLGVDALFTSSDKAVGQGNCLIPDSSGRVQWVTNVGGTSGVKPEVGAIFSGGGFLELLFSPRLPGERGSFMAVTLTRPVLIFIFVRSRGPRLSRQSPRRSSTTPWHTKGNPDLWVELSASAPTVAGVVSLLNDYELKPPLGFLHP
ncbi:hypothetical protein BJY52DRAFT_1418380 [Lactarius psammicola]|nr:hypothetical protein BJY52DRAFT_1418380 [Lactarius psammicola]